MKSFDEFVCVTHIFKSVKLCLAFQKSDTRRQIGESDFARDVADIFRDLACVFPRSKPVHLNRSARRSDKTQNITDSSRFTAAVSTDEAYHLALFYGEIFIENTSAVTVVFGKIFYFDYVFTHFNAPPKSLSSL